MTGDPFLDEFPDHGGCAGQVAAAAVATVVAGLAWVRWGVADTVASVVWLVLLGAVVVGVRFTWRQQAARRSEYDLIAARATVGRLLADRRQGQVS